MCSHRHALFAQSDEIKNVNVGESPPGRLDPCASSFINLIDQPIVDIIVIILSYLICFNWHIVVTVELCYK